MTATLKLNLPLDMSDITRPVIMVDDDKLDFMCAKRYYERSTLNNPIVHCHDGLAFLEYLQEVKHGEKPLPVLVLMDLNMPHLNGFEVVKKMREDTLFLDIPTVTMLSSSTDYADIERATEAGASGYLVKPYKPQEYQVFFDSLVA